MTDDNKRANAERQADGAATAVSAEPGWTLVSLPAEVDIGNADELRANLIAALRHGSTVVIVDMSRTSFCDCAGVSVLLAAASQALRAGAEIRVVARATPVLRMFGLTGLHLALRVYPTTGEALRGPPGTAGTGLEVGSALARLRRRQPTDVG